MKNQDSGGLRHRQQDISAGGCIAREGLGDRTLAETIHDMPGGGGTSVIKKVISSSHKPQMIAGEAVTELGTTTETGMLATSP